MDTKGKAIKILTFSLFPLIISSTIVLILVPQSINTKTLTQILTITSISIITSFISSFLYYLLFREQQKRYENIIGFIGSLSFLLLPIYTKEINVLVVVSIVFNSFFLFSSLVFLINISTLKSQEIEIKEFKNFTKQFIFLNPQIYRYILIITINTLMYELNKNEIIPINTLISLLLIISLEEISRTFAIYKIENRPNIGNDKLLNLTLSKHHTLAEKLSNTEKFVDALSLELQLNKTKQNEMKISLTKISNDVILLEKSLLERREKVEQIEISLNNIIGDLSTGILTIEYSISKLTNITDDARNKIEGVIDNISKALSKKEETQDQFSKIIPIFESLSVKIDSISDVLSNIVTVESKITKIISSISDEVGLLSVIATNTEIEASKTSKNSSLQRITANINETVMTIKELTTKMTNLHQEISQFFDYLSPISDSIIKHSERIKISITNLNSSTNNINNIISNASQDLISDLTYFDDMKNSISSISESMSTIRGLLEKASEILDLISSFKNTINDIYNTLEKINFSLEEITKTDNQE